MIFQTESDCIELPIKFQAKDAGHYTCRVTLSTADDIRVYFIDCTVIPEGNEAELEFTSPVHQAITQDIPIVSASRHCSLSNYNAHQTGK